MTTETKLLREVESIAKRHSKQGWIVTYSIGSSIGDGMVIERNDEASILSGDYEAIRLARIAGINCDNEGRIFGLHPKASPDK